ncbi:MAG: tRNA 5-hydroxyuridine modification protein YegQ [Zhongshania sp.]|uniref:prephenate-dependent tRNA uridine(34) hydroxylase TrhP n=1 Tax=Zhongshania sp. TaxID=1971902 RepID=UPI002619BF0C|nr:tRNA 5-hydroxyuridine modification protein YegQ [Zhongshania sp.]MDF1693719.1 tRNA 5-hydroxyuridine modification protein YegQ [Zhongshania sp.]
MIPELLSPAGSLRNMRYAFAYGADAVYAGQPRYSLRVRNNEFKDVETLRTGMDEAHALGKKFYLASNISPHNDKIRSYLRDLEPVIEMGPDALIMADPGLMMLVREKWPEQVIHLSVQANAVNWAAVKFWHQNGIQRVILSRELALDEIEEIRQRVPEMEIEVFVHGALCIAYSGRCLLSGYMNHRDPNQGACTNACRWKYQAHEAKEDETGDIVPVQNNIAVQTFTPEPQPAIVTEPVLLQQAQRPGEFMPAYEDEHGTYIMNSKDLRAVQHVERLAAMGVHSLKIEGRTKSHYYVARTAQVYRQAIDDAAHGKPFDMHLMDELETLANRGYTEGFYRRHPPKEYQNYEMGLNNAQQQQFVGEIIDAKDSVITVDVKNRFAVGDTLELMLPGGNTRFQLQTLSNKHGKSIDVAPGSGHQVRIPLNQALPESALKYGLLVKDIHA